MRPPRLTEILGQRHPMLRFLVPWLRQEYWICYFCNLADILLLNPVESHLAAEVLTTAGLYRAEGISWVQGSLLCFILKFASPPFSSPLPAGVRISKQNRHWTFDQINNPCTVLISIYSFMRVNHIIPETRQRAQSLDMARRCNCHRTAMRDKARVRESSERTMPADNGAKLFGIGIHGGFQLWLG